mgnify:CR=1 FL=1
MPIAVFSLSLPWQDWPGKAGNMLSSKNWKTTSLLVIFTYRQLSFLPSLGGLGWGRGGVVIKLKAANKQDKQKLIDTDNSTMLTRGKGMRSSNKTESSK